MDNNETINTLIAAYQDWQGRLETLQNEEHAHLFSLKEATNGEHFHMDGGVYKVRKFRGDTTGMRFSLIKSKETSGKSKARVTRDFISSFNSVEEAFEALNMDLPSQEAEVVDVPSPIEDVIEDEFVQPIEHRKAAKLLKKRKVTRVAPPKEQDNEDEGMDAGYDATDFSDEDDLFIS